MARHRRGRDTADAPLLQAVALLALGLLVLFPWVREWAWVTIPASLVLLAALFAYRYHKHRRQLIENFPVKVYNYDAPEPGVSNPPPQAIPASTALSSEWSPPQELQPQPQRLADQLQKIDWFQFEKLMAHAYRNLGYQVERRGGANPDGGIDLIIEKDGQRIAVQCKQWKAWRVGVKTVRELLGALADSGLQKGILITIRGYTAEAQELAARHNIAILDEPRVLSMLEDLGVAYDPEARAILEDTQKYCPKCEAPMVLRTASKGSTAGQPFWGCSRYPRCRYILRTTPGPTPGQDGGY